MSQRIDPGTAAVGFFRISISGIDLYHKPSTWKIIDLAGGTARCCVQNPFVSNYGLYILCRSIGPTTLYRLKNQKGHICIIEYQEFRDEYNASRKALHSVEKY